MTQTIRLNKKRRLTYENKKGLVGLLFISPWLIGVAVFFIYPMISSLKYVFYDITISNTVQSKFVGLDNLNSVLFEDPDNLRTIITSFLGTLGEVVLIMALSIFISIILCQDFFGRGFSRAIFALPIIVSSGVLMEVFKNDLFAVSMQNTSDVTIFQSAALEMSMIKMGIDPSFVSQIAGIVSGILDLLWKSGVQILLFIAGIQSIPSALYEVCAIEGATPWQTFWKVTFPLITPFILLNTVYTIVDNFTYFENPVMTKVNSLFEKTSYSHSTTLAVVYCMYVLIITGIVVWFISRRVHYVEK